MVCSLHHSTQTWDPRVQSWPRLLKAYNNRNTNFSSELALLLKFRNNNRPYKEISDELGGGFGLLLLPWSCGHRTVTLILLPSWGPLDEQRFQKRTELCVGFCRDRCESRDSLHLKSPSQRPARSGPFVFFSPPPMGRTNRIPHACGGLYVVTSWHVRQRVRVAYENLK